MTQSLEFTPVHTSLFDTFNLWLFADIWGNLSSFDFARDYILQKSGLIKLVASYGMYYARSESPLGQNILFWIDIW